MSIFKTLPLLLALSLATAQTPDDPYFWNIHVELQIVSLPEKLAAPIVAQLLDQTQIEAGYTKLQEYLVNGSAQLIAWPILHTRSEQAVVFETSRPFRYASVYGEQDTALPRAEGFDPISISFGYPSSAVSSLTLEIKPTLSPDHQTIPMTIDLQDSRVVGFHKEPTSSAGRHGIARKPDIQSLKLSTQILLRSGQRKLLSVFPEPSDHVKLLLIKATAKNPKADQ